MVRLIQIHEAAKRVRDAIESANQQYALATKNEYWLDDCGGEHLIVVEAWKSLVQAHTDGYAVVEMPMWWLWNGVPQGSRKRGPVNSALRVTGRCDIALLNSKQDVHALVEMKRVQNELAWRADLHRLVDAMKSYGPSRGGTLQFALLGAYVSGASETKFRNNYRTLERVATEAQNATVGKLRIALEPTAQSVSPKLWRDNEWRYASATILVESEQAANSL